MGEKISRSSEHGYMLYYRRPVQSRNKSLWLCYLTDEDQWALSSTPYFPKSVDLGYRWKSRTEGVITLNMVSKYKFGSDAMFLAIEKCRATIARTTVARSANLNSTSIPKTSALGDTANKDQN